MARLWRKGPTSRLAGGVPPPGRRRVGVWLRPIRRRPGLWRDPRDRSEDREKKWDFKMVNNTECGVLSTASDLVSGGAWMGTSSLWS